MSSRNDSRPHFFPLIALLATACAPATHYVQVAEALSSPTLTEPIRVAPRQMTDAQRVDACRSPQRIHKLSVAPAMLDLMAGTRYELSSLSVVAVDERGVAVAGGVPVVIEVEETEPPRVQLRSDDRDIDNGRLLALEPGEFHLRVRTICMVPPVPETQIRGIVHP